MASNIGVPAMLISDGPETVLGALGTTVMQVYDSIFGLLVFVVGYSVEGVFDRSMHKLAVLAMLAGVTLLLTLTSERMRITASTPKFRRTTLAQVIMKLLLMLLAFVAGVLGRILADQALAGPSRGSLTVLRMVTPAVSIVLLVWLYYTMVMLTSVRAEQLAALRPS